MKRLLYDLSFRQKVQKRFFSNRQKHYYHGTIQLTYMYYVYLEQMAVYCGFFQVPKRKLLKGMY